MSLIFNSISSYKEGDLFNILFGSYEKLLVQNIKNKEKYIDNWKQFDRSSFNNPQKGKCVFITSLDNKQIGLCSYDQSQFPEYGIIGHNCILPDYRNQGYGKKQIEYLLEIFSNNQCKKVKVETGSIEFYLPAQKMYQSLGFIEVGRHFDEIRDYDVIEYEKKLL